MMTMMAMAMLLLPLPSVLGADSTSTKFLRILPCDSWSTASPTDGWTIQHSGKAFKLVNIDVSRFQSFVSGHSVCVCR